MNQMKKILDSVLEMTLEIIFQQTFTRRRASDLRDVVRPDQLHHPAAGPQLLLREDLRQDSTEPQVQGTGQRAQHEETDFGVDADVSVESDAKPTHQRRRCVDTW